MFVIKLVYQIVATLVAMIKAADVIEYSALSAQWTYDMSTNTQVGIHKSCNASESIMLQKALGEMKLLAQVSKDHLLNYGHNSSIVQKFFGNGNIADVVGTFEYLLNGNKDNVLLRCDNIDGNCQFADWAGHWRGLNATTETVICPLSYEIRQPLEHMCMKGYTVSDPNFSAGYFFGQDLLHRMFHIPQVSLNVINHYAESYEECLSLGLEKADEAIKNSHTLQYFAVEVFAFELVMPGIGCPGDNQAFTTPEGGLPASTTSTSTATLPSSTAKNNGCKAHEDHWHCPPGVAQPTYLP